MISQSFSYTVAGLALLLFALRFLIVLIDREVSRYLTTGLQRITRQSTTAVLTGFFATFITQASSITIISTMNFLNRGIIPLEKSILIMLGACLGSTIKGWYFFPFSKFLAPFFLLMGVLGELIFKSHRYRRISEIIVLIGITFLGFHLIESGFIPLIHHPLIQSFLTLSIEQGSFAFLKTLLFGFALCSILQSSSAVLMLILSCSAQNLVSLPASIALVLGANLGTTITPLIACVKQESDAKRLALSHLLIKTFGVGLVFIYYRTHIDLLNGFNKLLGIENRPTLLVLSFHTWFNFMNLLTWWLLLPVLSQITHWMIPGKEKLTGTSPFTFRIQQLLENLGGKALSEGIHKLQQVVRDLHWMSDSIFHYLEGKNEKEKSRVLLDESLQRCEKSSEVMDTVRDLAWRYLKSHETSQEGSKDSKQKVAKVLLLIADLKTFQAVLYSCIQTLKYDEITPLSKNSKLILNSFRVIRNQLNSCWDVIYSLENSTLTFQGSDSEAFLEEDLDASVFELSIRLKALESFMKSQKYQNRYESSTITPLHKMKTDPLLTSPSLD